MKRHLQKLAAASAFGLWITGAAPIEHLTQSVKDKYFELSGEKARQQREDQIRRYQEQQHQTQSEAQRAKDIQALLERVNNSISPNTKKDLEEWVKLSISDPARAATLYEYSGGKYDGLNELYYILYNREVSTKLKLEVVLDYMSLHHTNILFEVYDQFMQAFPGDTVTQTLIFQKAIDYDDSWAKRGLRDDKRWRFY
jgi:heme exporter protein D